MTKLFRYGIGGFPAQFSAGGYCLSEEAENLEKENKELKENLIDCLEELTENNTITPKVAEYFDRMREKYLGNRSTE